MKTMAIFLGTALVSVAMSQDVISTDRPSFSDGALIVPKGRWQIEAGYTFNDLNGTRSETFGEFLFRYPWSDKVELRLSNVTWGRVSGNDGLLDPILGVKLKLHNGVAGKSPDLALILQSTIPAGGRVFRVDRPQPTAKIAFYQQTDSTTGFGGNLVVSDLDGFTQYAASLYLSKTLTKRTGGFAEVYRLMPLSDGGPNANFVDAGVTYLLNSKTQLDARVGTGYGWFFGFGVSYRF